MGVEREKETLVMNIEAKRKEVKEGMARRRTTTKPKKKEESVGTSSEEVPSPHAALSRALEGLEATDRVAIFSHPSPDPDSMASSTALQWILRKKFDLGSQAFSEGEVSHPQNRTMANILGLQLSPLEEYDPDDFARVIVIDATTKNSSIDKVDLIIDHHRVDHDKNAKYSHIEQVGAVSTLIWEYIRAMGLTIEDDIDESMATALFFGIRTDTQELTSETTTDRDFRASEELTEFINRKKLSNVINYPLPTYFFEGERVLTQEGNSSSLNSCFVGTVGIISAAKRDSLPMLADKMVRMDGIETSVVFAVIEDEIVASVRSVNAAFDVNVFCHKVFGKDYSGGKLGIAGAHVPLGIASIKDLPEDLKEEVWSALKKKLFHKILHIAGDN